MRLLGLPVMRHGCLGMVLCAVLTAGCKAPVLTVDDVVVLPGETTRLMACVEREPILGLCKDVERVPVDFVVNGQEVGTAKTDQEGVAQLEHFLPPGLGQYEARTRVDGREFRAPGTVYTWDQQRVVIVVDIDHTISQTNYEGLLRIDGVEESVPVPGAVQALRALANDFHIVYLTGRPRYLITKTHQWLRDCEFPAGPVITSVRVRDLADPGAFKLRQLHTLRALWPTLLIGIGNRAADAEAYGENGMLSLIVSSRPGPHPGSHAIRLRDWAMVSEFFTANQDILASADQLREVIAGRAMLQRFVEPYQAL